MPIAVPDAITSLAVAEQTLGLSRWDGEEDFFAEWRDSLLSLSEGDRASLAQLRRRYLYQRSVGQLLEGTVNLLITSPLLAITGFYDPPFQICAEPSVELVISDGTETLQGRLDVLVLRDRLWIVVIESKKTALSVWTALPQTLAYLAANPNPERPSFGFVTNGDEMFFVKLQPPPRRCYDLSRIFSPLTSLEELAIAAQILRNLGHQ
ncbi:MAG: hypothetical protein Fur0042_09010 [Cyanophyceae cyanobacterium]